MPFEADESLIAEAKREMSLRGEPGTGAAIPVDFLDHGSVSTGLAATAAVTHGELSFSRTARIICDGTVYIRFIHSRVITDCDST